MNAAFAQYRRQRKANVLMPSTSSWWVETLRIAYSLLEMALQMRHNAPGNAVESGPFAVDNLIGGIADAVIDLSFNFRSERFAEFFRQFVERNRAGISGRQTALRCHHVRR